MEYSWWIITGETFEGDETWGMYRTSHDWDEEMVFEKASQYCNGGVGGDWRKIISVEVGHEDDVYTDYCE